jgi:hypothetical protein
MQTHNTTINRYYKEQLHYVRSNKTNLYKNFYFIMLTIRGILLLHKRIPLRKSF